MRCSVSSSWLTLRFSFLTSSSRTNWVLMPLTAASRVSVSNSSAVLPWISRYLSRVRPIWPSWWCSRLCLRVLISSSSSFSGTGTSTSSSSFSRTRSWAWVAWSNCFMFARRLRLSALSSSRVSNSEASCANSSSSSGSSRAATWVTLTVTSASLPAGGAALQLGGEGGLLTGGQALHGVVDAVQQLTGADGVRDTVGDAVLEHLAVDLGLQVDGDDVAVLGGTLDGRGGREALTQLLHGLLDVLVRHLDGVDLDLDAGVVRDLEGRADVDLGGEVQRLAVLQLGDVDVGLAQRAQLGLVDRLGVELRQRVVDGLLQHRTAAEPLVDHAGGDLALTEALHRDLLVDLLVRRVEAVLELLEGHLDSEPNPGRVQGLHGALHGSVSLWLTSRVLPEPDGPGGFRRPEEFGP